MELREFVSNALIQIAQGVKDAQHDESSAGALVNPRVVDVKGRADQQGGMLTGNGELIREVQFDVVVTAMDGDGNKDEIDVDAASLLEVGAPAELMPSNNAVNRIRFRVPIALPSILTR
jgi:hypothetical protein